MSFLKKINKIRRNVMGGITNNLGAPSKGESIAPLVPTEIKRILICRPNHRLGNQLLITPLVQEISETFPNCKIDLFVKGNLSLVLFENYGNIDRIIRLPKKHFKQFPQYIWGWLKLKKHRYDLVFNVDKRSSSGKLSTKFARGKHKFFGETLEDLSSKYDDFGHLAKYPVYNLRSLLPQTETYKPVYPLNLNLASSEIINGQKTLEKIVKSKQKTIALFTYATGGKRHSEAWWGEFYEKLKNEFPNYNFVEILPKENVSQIGFSAPTFYSMDIREITSVMAAMALFIGTDSGMMHLSAASQAPTIGLFSVTKKDKYEPYGNQSLGINTRETNMDEIIQHAKEILQHKVGPE